LVHGVVIFSFPGVKAFDVVAPSEVFTHAAHLTDGGYEVAIASISGGPVTAESGLTFPTVAMPEPGMIDTLVLPGGSGVHSALSDSTTMSWIRTASSRARRSVGIGAGTLLVAEAATPAGRQDVTHRSGSEHSARVFPPTSGDFDSLVARSSSNARWTAGTSGGIDTALAIVEADFGAEVAQEVARCLVLYRCGAGAFRRLDAPLSTPRATRDAIRQAQDAIEADPGARHTVAELARRAAMSSRHFVRVFLAEVGETPSAYVERARTELACRKLAETTDTVAAIAARCGFGTAETMRRTFARRLGVSPTEYRRRLDRHGDGGAEWLTPAPMPRLTAPAVTGRPNERAER